MMLNGVVRNEEEIAMACIRAIWAAEDPAAVSKPKASDQIRASMAKNIQLGKFRMLVVIFHDELWPFGTAPNDSEGAKRTYN